MRLDSWQAQEVSDSHQRARTFIKANYQGFCDQMREWRAGTTPRGRLIEQAAAIFRPAIVGEAAYAAVRAEFEAMQAHLILKAKPENDRCPKVGLAMSPQYYADRGLDTPDHAEFFVRGDEMYPSLQRGQPVVIQRGAALRIGDMVATAEKGEPVFWKLAAIPGYRGTDKALLTQNHAIHFEPHICELNDERILGRVVWYGSNLL